MNSNPLIPHLMSIKLCSEYTGLSVRRIRHLLDNDILKYVLCGKERKVFKRSVDKFLDTLYNDEPTGAEKLNGGYKIVSPYMETPEINHSGQVDMDAIREKVLNEFNR